MIGVPGIAVSLSINRPWHETVQESMPLDDRLHFDAAADFTARLVKVASRASVGTNPQRQPNLPREGSGARVTRLGRRFYKDELVEVRDEGREVGYDIYNNPPGHRGGGGDFAAIENDEISITPVHLELTDTPGLESSAPGTWTACSGTGSIRRCSPRSSSTSTALVDTTEMIHQSMRRHELGPRPRRYPRETLLATWASLPRQMELIDTENADLLLEAYRSHHEQHHDALIGEFPGVEESLARLGSAGIKVAVTSNAASRWRWP